MIIKTLLLAALAVATPLLSHSGGSPKLASYNPSDTETEIYKSSADDYKHSSPSEFLLSVQPHRSENVAGSGYLGISSTPSISTAAPAACTTGPSASADDDSGFNIKDYTKITPYRTNSTSYEVDKSWHKKHFVSGPHWFGYSHAEGQFGAWKCQFTCNAAEDCNGYFVWYEGVGMAEGEHMMCVLFDAVIPKSVLVPTNSTGIISGGAYDRICKTHVKST
ncbi:hypothetical protein QBC36DRAFT_227205 [Triangularia setosa]|uniref:Uncharacterized protein n=1 Tax=Triangularia setosa TaxID=2587417 RepID=A0AAN7ACZ2_9PEZI|nr:hypothetical protein QBC36DRAFT_227205 [Podospora setosa]